MNYPSWLARLLVHSGVAQLLPGLRRRLDGGTEYLRYYSDRLVSAPLAQLERLAAALEECPPDVIDLTAGSPRFDLLPSSTTRMPADRRGWPCVHGLPELRGAVAARLFEEARLVVSPAEEVLITAGALGAVQVILDALVNRGDAVVLSDPGSPMYPLLVRTRGANVRWAPVTCDEGRLKVRFDLLAPRLRGARLLVVNSPHNPTGGVIAPEDLEHLVWWCHRHDVLILSDETFGLYQEGDRSPSVATLPRAKERTLTVGSVSKSHALAWARVGWVAAHRHLLRPCLATAALRAPFVPTLSQQIALQALRTSTAAFAPIEDEFASRRRFVFDRLSAVGLEADWPGGGYFLWVRVPRGSSGRKFCESLLSERRVKLTPGELFGPSGTGYVRLSLVAEDGRLDEGLNRIVEHVKGAKAVEAASKAA